MFRKYPDIVGKVKTELENLEKNKLKVISK